MRYFHASTAALVCALLLSGSALLANCSLASYSETRSFRDALDGRSMEDAISGPVDKDTSSYGDRTSSSPSLGPSATSGGMQAPASSMMLTIPANGNLNMVMQQQEVNPDEQQQQRQTPGSELEREAGPIAGQAQMSDNEQQLMEQKFAKNQRGPSNGRSGSNGKQTMGQMMAPSTGTRNGRQQLPQQPREGNFNGASTKGAAGSSESGFGEEPSKQSRPQSDQVPLGYGGQNRASGGMRPANGPDGADNEDQQQLQSPAPADQQVMNDNGDQPQQPEKSYTNGAGDDQQMAAKQRAMAAMLMSMNNGMKYSRLASPNGPQQAMTGGQQMAPRRGFGDKKAATSSMAQNMMASLANKAAYMEMQQQKQQRQLAPPPMMVSMVQQRAGNGQYPKQGQMNAAPMGMMDSAAYGTGNGMRGGLRRANQRKMEKKMSPSMVNAMLNKMLSKQREQEQSGSMGMYPNSKPATMAMLMKSPMGAEILAQMVMPQMAGAISEMPQAKKEQYKRVMMAAIMQQQQQAMANEENANRVGQQQQQPEAESYGQSHTGETSSRKLAQSTPGAAKSRNGAFGGATNGDNMMTTTTPISPITMMMNTMAKSSNKPNGGYGGQANQQSGAQGPANQSNRNGKGLTRNGKPTTMSPMSDFGPAQVQQMMDQPNQQEQSVDGEYQNGNQLQRELPVTMSAQQQMGGIKGAMGRAQTNGRLMPMAMGTGYGQGAGMMQPGMKVNGGSRKAAAGKYAADQARQTTEPSAGFGNDADQQQRDLTPATMTPASMMSQTKSQVGEMTEPTQGFSRYAAGTSDDQMASPMSGRQQPMNGFRQAYEDQQEQQQQQQRISGDNNGDNRGAPAPGMGTKSQGAGPMARPKAIQQSYGQQQPDSDQQQQIQDEYGAAPMGMAEPFAFDYKIEDDYGNGQYRKEESDKNGVVRGSYGYTDVSGIYRHVEYVADENGFRANIKSNEPGLSSETATNDDNSANSNANANAGDANDDRSSGNGGGSSVGDSQQNSPTNMDSNGNSLSNGANNQPQQQSMMMVPTQTEWNENGEN